jgi:hypothetical protein
VAISGTLSLKRSPAPAETPVSAGAPPARPMPATTERLAGGQSAGNTGLTRPFSSTLNARAIKATIVLYAAEIAMLNAPDGQRRTTLRIKVAGRNVSVDIATKSLRKAITTITETGADGCVAIVQGKLERGDTVSEAGLVVQLKTPKATS